MSLMVCQIDDPYTAKIIRSYNAKLEPDGSLDTFQLEFVKKGDVFMRCTHSKGITTYDPFIHPSLSPTIPPSIWRPSTRMINGTTALLLISSADYNKVTAQQTILSLSSPQSTASQPPKTSKQSMPPPQTADLLDSVRSEQKDLPHRRYQLPQPASNTPLGPSGVTILIRQLRDFDDPNIPVVRTWEVNLEHDLSLDTSKLAPNKPDETYYSRATNGSFYSLNINYLPKVKPSYLEYYLQDFPGIALPVLLIMSDSDYNTMQRRQRTAPFQ